MAGTFELFIDAESLYRFRLTAPDGTVMAVSRPFSDKAAAVAGIAAVREYAGMGLIADLTPAVRVQAPAVHRAPGAESHKIRRLSSAEVHARPVLSQPA
jgi:uncharacterized protein YegP (UPF0339 family)